MYVTLSVISISAHGESVANGVVNQRGCQPANEKRIGGGSVCAWRENSSAMARNVGGAAARIQLAYLVSQSMAKLAGQPSGENIKAFGNGEILAGVAFGIDGSSAQPSAWLAGEAAIKPSTATSSENRNIERTKYLLDCRGSGSVAGAAI